MTTKKAARKPIRKKRNAIIIQEEAMEYLRKSQPEFFSNKTNQELSAIIISEMGPELAKHQPVELAGMLANIMSLMFQMGTSALKSIRCESGRSMSQIFVDDYINPGQADE